MSDQPARRPPARPRGQQTDDAAVRALRDKLAGVLRRLPDIERSVLERRMGLLDGAPMTPTQTAEQLKLTVREVKEIEARAFQRIREVGPVKGLERFLGRSA